MTDTFNFSTFTSADLTTIEQALRRVADIDLQRAEICAARDAAYAKKWSNSATSLAALANRVASMKPKGGQPRLTLELTVAPGMETLDNSSSEYLDLELRASLVARDGDKLYGAALINQRVEDSGKDLIDMLRNWLENHGDARGARAFAGAL
jgi:hypothetical protein